MEKKPEQVRNAQRNQNAEALRAMGTKGGINAGLMNADRKNQRTKDLDAFIAQQEQIYHVSDEGDVLPPEANIIETLTLDRDNH